MGPGWYKRAFAETDKTSWHTKDVTLASSQAITASIEFAMPLKMTYYSRGQ